MAIECNSSCFLKGKDCKDIRDCMCNCGPLKSVNESLYVGCKSACASSKASDRPKDAEDYKCNFVGGEALFHFYDGYLASECGYNHPDDTNQNCLVNPESPECQYTQCMDAGGTDCEKLLQTYDGEDNDTGNDGSSINMQYVMYGFLALIAVAFLFILKK